MSTGFALSDHLSYNVSIFHRYPDGQRDGKRARGGRYGNKVWKMCNASLSAIQSSRLRRLPNGSRFADRPSMPPAEIFDSSKERTVDIYLEHIYESLLGFGRYCLEYVDSTSALSRPQTDVHTISVALHTILLYAIEREAVAPQNRQLMARELYWGFSVAPEIIWDALGPPVFMTEKYNEVALAEYVGAIKTPTRCVKCDSYIWARTRKEAQRIWADSFLERALCENCIDCAQSVVHLPAGYVYILKSGDAYKIGKTNDLTRRITQIQPVLPHPVELLHVIPTDEYHRLEKRLHLHFAHKHLNGEWFALDEADIKYILSLKE